MNRLARIVLTVACGGIFAMWVYYFGFASRESFNRIGDDAWKARSEARCLIAENERFALQDLEKMNANDTAALKKKADIVETATDSLERAINDIAMDTPTDAKGQELVPQWISDYRIYIQNRRQFIDKLRTASTRPYFSETEVEGVPISERIGKFARENDMRTCQPPLDLSV
jgi:vacuolar-type H+-ATPase subunit H